MANINSSISKCIFMSVSVFSCMHVSFHASISGDRVGKPCLEEVLMFKKLDLALTIGGDHQE